MQIYGPYRLSTTQATSGPERMQTPKPAGDAKSVSGAARPTAAPVDQLDLSSAASSVSRMEATSQVAGNGEIRIDRVAEIRRQIASGNYETPEKLDAALDRLLDEIG